MKVAHRPISGKSLAKALAATIVVFVLLSMAIYYASIYVLVHSSFRFSRIAAGSIHVDILIVGNSRARDLVTGRGPENPPTVFNLAYNRFSREGAFAWIKLFFHQGNTAKTIVFETSTLYTDFDNCDGKPYWPLYPSLMTSARLVCPKDVEWARYFPLTTFNSEQFLRALYYFAIRRQGDQNWADDHEIPADVCSRLPLDDIYKFRDAATRREVSEVSRQISDLKQWLDRGGFRARLVFVLAPFFAEPRTLPGIEDMERINGKLLGAENNLSLATALGSDCGNFADAVHTARNGQVKTRTLLFKYLGFDSYDSVAK